MQSNTNPPIQQVNFMVDLVTQLLLNPSQIILEPLWKGMSQKLFDISSLSLPAKGIQASREE